MFEDSLTNLVANLAAGNAKSVYDRFSVPCLPDEQIESIYRGNWIGRKIIDLPVTDMMRPWRAWQAEKDQITAIEDGEKRHGIRAKFALAQRLARLYGGSAILLGADVGNSMRPLNLNAVRKDGLRYVTVLSKRMIQPLERNLDPEDPLHHEPVAYRLSSQMHGSIEVHPSRVIRFIGAERPDIDMNADGWGDSILQIVYSAIHAAALSHTGIAELIHEAKVDVIKIDNLGSMLSTQQGTEVLTKRFSNASLLKSINNTLLIDTKEEHARTSTSFAGLPDVLMALMQVVSGAADIPIVRFLGTSPKGLNATGESDLINYYDMLDGLRTTDLQPKLEVLDELLWRDATGSAAPKETYFTFNPLWQLSAEKKATVEKTRAETANIYANMGLMPEEALARGVVNQLIENETFPGLEAEIEKYLAENEELVPEDPMAELEVERAEAEIRSIGNGAQGPKKTGDRAAPGDAIGRSRNRLADYPELARQIRARLDAGKRH